MKKLFFALLLSVSAMSSLVGCGGGGGTDTDAYYSGWYDVYGNRCGGLGPGCNYYSNGLKIIDVEDPYFQSSYVLEYDVWFYTDEYGVSSSYIGWAWWSPNGVLYDSYGNALNEKKSEGRDHVGDVAETQDAIISTVAADFSEKHSLSLETAKHVAQTLNDWAVIGKDRARTAADINATTERLYGLDVSEVKLALEKAREGDLAALDQAAAKAASNWGTTPETFKEIQKVWFDRQIKAQSK